MNVNLYKVFASVFYPLKKSYILDSNSSIYMTKDKHRLFKYKLILPKDKLKCRKGYMAIQGYKNLDIQFISQRKKKPKTLQLFQIVYCSDFPFNIVSFQRLKEKNIDWSYQYKILTTLINTEPLRRIKKIYKQYVLEHRPILKIYITTIITTGI